MKNVDDMTAEELQEAQVVLAEKGLTLAKWNFAATIVWAGSFLLLAWQIHHHLTIAVVCR